MSRNAGMKRMRRGLATILTVFVAAASIVGGASAAQADSVEPHLVADDTPTAGKGYAGDPVAEAKLVASEVRRVIDVDSLISTAAQLGVSQSKPYRLAVGAIPSLVLVARSAPYTLPELAEIAPRTVALADDGTYQVNENIVVAPGAVLRVSAKTGVTVHLLSGPDGFVSIVAAGGSLVVKGTGDVPVAITSWNPVVGMPDTDTSDGRAYVRVYGGKAEVTDAKFADLGFWSGITGGVSFTGTDIPVDANTDPDAVDATAAQGTSLDGEILPADGGVETLSLDPENDDLGYSSGLVQSVTFSGDAFGIFVSNSDRIEIRNSKIENSLVDGLVFHRDVTNSDVISTSATGNARDGFRITRATSSVELDRVTATHNGRNGISLEGGALATGPNATGIATTVYGDNRVTGSTSTDNARYGIGIVGGTHILISGNLVERNVMGIVVTNNASAVTIKDNEVTGSEKQGIAFRTGGLDSVVASNTVTGGDIGIYVRDAGGRIANNRVTEVTNHGIALVGNTGTTVIVGNEITGAGPSAIDTTRTSGSAVRNNDTGAWHNTKPLAVVLSSIFQPLTIMWLLIAVVMLISLPLSLRRRHAAIVDPYANHAPLSTFTRGELTRDQVGKAS